MWLCLPSMTVPIKHFSFLHRSMAWVFIFQNSCRYMPGWGRYLHFPISELSLVRVQVSSSDVPEKYASGCVNFYERFWGLLTVLWPPHAKSWLIGKDSDAERDWGQEEKGTTEDGMAGWHHWLDGPESEWTPGVDDGQGGLACCDSWGHKESDTTERLNWTELKVCKTNPLYGLELVTF